MELTEDDIKAIRETRDTVIRLETIIGDGNEGLCADIHRHNQSISNLYEKHNRLSQKFWLLVGILGGSGVISGGTMAIIQAMKS